MDSRIGTVHPLDCSVCAGIEAMDAGWLVARVLVSVNASALYISIIYRIVQNYRLRKF